MNPHLSISRAWMPPWGCLWVPAYSRCLLRGLGLYHRFKELSRGLALMGFVPIDILRVLVIYWIVYQCFFELSTGYPQGYPQGTTG